MTREEAIEIFKRLKENAPNEMHLETVGTAQELFEMAIQALSQEPCDDAVSRQAVINAIENDCMKGGLGSCFACYNDAQAFRGEIEKLPSVTLQQDTVPFDFELYQAGLMDMPKEMIEVLEQIRAEIKALSPEPTAYDVVDGNPIKDAVWETLADVLQIIDRHMKGDSE